MKKWFASGALAIGALSVLGCEVPAALQHQVPRSLASSPPAATAYQSNPVAPVIDVTPLPANSDIAYGGHPSQRLDIILPEQRVANGRVVLYFHGGAWTEGDKADRIPATFTDLLADGYVLVSANYRLAQQAPWPAQINDTKAAIRWVQKNISTYGARGDKVVVGGWSAGGHLAALAATTPGVWEPGPGATRVRGVILYKAVVDFAPVAMRTNFGTDPLDPMLGLFNGPIPAGSVPYLTVETWQTPDDPNMYIVSGGADLVAPAASLRRLRDVATFVHRGDGGAAWYDEIPLAGHEVDAYSNQEYLRMYLNGALK